MTTYEQTMSVAEGRRREALMIVGRNAPLMLGVELIGNAKLIEIYLKTIPARTCARARERNRHGYRGSRCGAGGSRISHEVGRRPDSAASADHAEAETVNKWQTAALAIVVAAIWGGALLGLAWGHIHVWLEDRKRRKVVDQEFTPVAPAQATLEATPTQWVYIDPRGRFGTQGQFWDGPEAHIAPDGETYVRPPWWRRTLRWFAFWRRWTAKEENC